MGWLTTEELWWDAEGRLRTHAPSTYKIPAVGDVPADFRVSLCTRGRNREDAIYRSKAVGEPPLMLGIAVFQALRDAVAACGDGRRPRSRRAGDAGAGADGDRARRAAAGARGGDDGGVARLRCRRWSGGRRPRCW